MSFDGDKLVGVEPGFWIGDADPAEIEVLPASQGGFGGFEGGFAVANLAARVVAYIRRERGRASAGPCSVTKGMP